jgi:hypothetical protein
MLEASAGCIRSRGNDRKHETEALNSPETQLMMLRAEKPWEITAKTHALARRNVFLSSAFPLFSARSIKSFNKLCWLGNSSGGGRRVVSCQYLIGGFGSANSMDA